MSKRSIEELRKMQIIYLTVEEFIELQETVGKENNLSSYVPNIMSIDDAVSFTGYKKSTIYRKTCENAIPHYRRGNRVIFKKEELEEWLLDNKVDTVNNYCLQMDSALQQRAQKKRII